MQPEAKELQEPPVPLGSGWDEHFTMDLIERLDALETRVASQLDQLTSAHEERITAIKVGSTSACMATSAQQLHCCMHAEEAMPMFCATPKVIIWRTVVHRAICTRQWQRLRQQPALGLPAQPRTRLGRQLSRSWPPQQGDECRKNRKVPH